MGAEQPVDGARRAASERAASDGDLAAFIDGAIVVYYASLVAPDAVRERLIGVLERRRESTDGGVSRSAAWRPLRRQPRHRSCPSGPVPGRFGGNGALRIRSERQTQPRWAEDLSIASEFNVSHSDDRLAVTVSTLGPIGIDIERLRPVPDAEDLAARILSANELATFRALPESQRERAFLVTWVRKEACLKAVGAGFSVPAPGFEVMGLSNSAGGAPVAGVGADWHLHTLDPGGGYVGAVVALGPDRQVASFEATWNPWGELSVAPRAKSSAASEPE